MDATTMPRSNSLVKRLTKDFPDLTFTPGDSYSWSASHQRITYPTPYQDALLLHEVAHALLAHNSFDLDIELLQKERAAWEYVEKELAPRYGVTISPSTREDALDTYRRWLHQRSLCTVCKINAPQNQTGAYKCATCKRQWVVSDSTDTRVYQQSI